MYIGLYIKNRKNCPTIRFLDLRMKTDTGYKSAVLQSSYVNQSQ